MQKDIKAYATFRLMSAPQRRAIPCRTQEELNKTLMELCSYAAVSDVRVNHCGRLPKGTVIVDQKNLM